MLNRSRFGHRMMSNCNRTRQESTSARHPDFPDGRRVEKVNVALPIQTPAEMGAFRERDFEANAAIINVAKIKLE